MVPESTLTSFIPLYVLAHKVTLEDKSLEKIVNERMALMQKIKSGALQDSAQPPSESDASDSPSKEKKLSEWEKRLEGMS